MIDFFYDQSDGADVDPDEMGCIFYQTPVAQLRVDLRTTGTLIHIKVCQIRFVLI